MSITVTCAVADCDGLGVLDNKTGKRYLVKGYCCAHYRRLKRYGSPNLGRTKNGSPMAFIHGMLESNQVGCIIWPYSRVHGYADIRIKGKHYIVSRLVLEMTVGRSPSVTMDACHSCGNGHLGCVNPAHLRWDTRKANVEDMRMHGTMVMGEKSPHAKLKESEIKSIRASRLMQAELAKIYGVNQQTISKIKLGLRCRHLL